MTAAVLDAPFDVESFIESEPRVEGRRYGSTEPRLWTRPLRELTRETSAGFDVIEFGEQVCGITLYPWQKWLLIHALELRHDGTYRFQKVHVLVGRQNGKTTVVKLLMLYWLYCESLGVHDIVPEFKIVATAQDLGKAEETWEEVLDYCDPNPPKDKDPKLMPLVPAFQQLSRRPSRRTGKYRIRTKHGASYAVTAMGTKGGRGGSYSRVFFDELREHRTWDAWNAVKNTRNAQWNPQVWTCSNAGDRRSIVLKELRGVIIKAITAWREYVEAGLWSVEQWANQHDSGSALFEWSAEPGLPVTNPEGILQANPSIGWSHMSLEALQADALGGEPEADFRTEVLCQWVESLVTPHIDPVWWDACEDQDAYPDGRLVASIDSSMDGKRTYIGIVGEDAEGVPVGELIARRSGTIWAIEYMKRLRENHGINEVAIQARGCTASEFIDPLRKEGFTVHEIGGSHLGAAPRRLKDKVESGGFKHRGQNVLTLSANGTQARKLGEQMVWDRVGSIVDAMPTVCISQALYARETFEPEPVAPSAYESRGLRTVG